MKLKDKSRKIIKWALIAVLLIGSYALSYFLNGFYETNKKLLILIFCVACGFAGFFIIYYTAYMITLIVDNKKSKRTISKNEINCSEELTEVIENNELVFHYDTNLNFKENAKIFGEMLLKMLSKITTNGKAEKKYSFLNFTVYEVLDAVKSCESVVREKIEGILDLPIIKFGDFKNKPISFVEKKLSSIIEKELNGETEVEVKVEEQPKTFWQAVKSKVAKVALDTAPKLLKTQIEESVNFVIKFVGTEALKIRIVNKGNEKEEE